MESHSSRQSSRGLGVVVAVGGRGRLARPHLPRSATCKQALGGRRLLQPRVRLGLGTGNRGLQLGAAHPAQSQASAAPSFTCLLPALVPSQGMVSSHTPPFPLPAPRYCIVRCVRTAPSGKAPTDPRSFCPLVHLAAPPVPPQGGATQRAGNSPDTLGHGRK